MRQPSLQSVVVSSNDKKKAADDMVFAFTIAGIPLDKMDHPLMPKYTTIASCLLQCNSDFPKVNGPTASFLSFLTHSSRRCKACAAACLEEHPVVLMLESPPSSHW